MAQDGSAQIETVDWYFDFISPFAYLAFHALDRLPQGIEVRFQPVLFAGLLKHWGQKGPAEIPPKREWTFRWLHWLASRQGIPFQPPPRHPFVPLPYLRLCLAADNRREAVAAIFDALWTRGEDAEDARTVSTLADALAVDEARLQAPSVKQALHDSTNAAIARGVFGVPTLFADDELFWGVDAMPFALERIQARHHPHGE
ncbi:2-hydroxychromene-2-carboxylate isomerase [Algiphilus sp.]|uniref:2-hydroxychromene-2-carboxylate isomerase n=1 Tax=Algiphilus sp. TaxID=1872431 RepID=UPI003B52695A